MGDKKVYKYNNLYRIIILSSVFLIEYLLFRSYAYREVIGKVPRNMDQIMYMQCSYELYDALIHRNWELFLDLIRVRIRTGGIPLVGVAYLILFGNSYFSFLLMNFGAFLIVQTVSIYTVYKITNQWSYVWICLGLFISLKSPFYWAGDLLDIRADFIALCLYTCWTAVYLLFIKSGEDRYLKMSAVFAGILVFCRMLSAIYVCGSLVLFEIVNVFIWNKDIKKTLKKYCVYALIMFSSGAWFLLACFPKFFAYYFKLHVASDDPKVRRMEQGVYTLWDNIMFYPKSLIKDHIGSYICIFILFCCAVVGICCLVRKMHIVINKNIAQMLIFVGISIVLPIIILTIDESKSSVVANVVSGNVILIMVIILNVVLEQHSKIKILCVFISCSIGIIGYWGNSTSNRKGYSDEEQYGLITINDAIANYIINSEKQETKMFVDRTLDGINAMTSRYWMSMHGDMGHDVYDYTYNYDVLHSGIVKKTQASDIFLESEVEWQLKQADIIIVSPNGYGESLYMQDKELDKYREKIYDYAVKNLNLLTEDYAYGTLISVFVK